MSEIHTRYTTGNAMSDNIGQLNFTGNVIPSVWFQTVTGSSGKPNLLACQILSEIVYWYRPTEVRDEATGQFVGYRTKFKGDLLQKSYKSLAELYHVSKQQVIRAVVFLEKEIGVIQRVFRSVPGKDGMVYNNVLFIAIDPDKLRKLTYPMDCDEPHSMDDIDYDDGSSREEDDSDNVDKENDVDNFTPLPSNLMGPSHQKKRDPLIKFDGTYTENNTETNNSYYNSILSCPNESEKDRDRQTEELDYDSIVRKQICYDAIRQDLEAAQDADSLDVLDVCVSIAASVYRNTGRYLQISGERMPIGTAVSLVRKLDMYHVKHIVSSFLATEKKIKNVRAYMLACIFNTIRTLPAQNVNLFVSHGKGVVP